VRGMLHALDVRQMHTSFSLENLKEKGHLENLGINGRIIFKFILKKREFVDCIRLLQYR
jgi:hypothetical protein